jgi:hypothetical protein
VSLFAFVHECLQALVGVDQIGQGHGVVEASVVEWSSAHAYAGGPADYDPQTFLAKS